MQESRDELDAEKRRKAVEKTRAWRLANPEKRRAQQAKERARDPEGLRAYMSKYKTKNRARLTEAERLRYAEDPKPFAERRDRWRGKNKDKVREATRKHYEKNRERLAAQKVEYRKNKPEVSAAARARRRAHLRKAEGTYTKDELKALFVAQDYLCAEPTCRVSVREASHADHVQPLSRGGSNWITNIQILCPSCNRRKHTMDAAEWARANGRPYP